MSIDLALSIKFIFIQILILLTLKCLLESFIFDKLILKAYFLVFAFECKNLIQIRFNTHRLFRLLINMQKREHKDVCASDMLF